ncbi:MAG: hypothetical protein FJZ63_07740, partial [Chlamydiae bacterium]|nr:hypothetical protein [Chlamydiota bacterium]
MTINYHIKPDDKNQLGNYDYEYDISDSAYGHMDTTQKERLQERMALLAPCVSAFYRWQKEQCRDKTLHPFKFPFDACIAEDDVLFSTAVKSTFDSVYQYHLQNNKSKMGLTPSTQAASATSVATSIAAAPSQIITQAHIEELCALNQLVFEGLYEGENGLASPISLAAAIELYVAGDKTNPLQIKQLTETLHKPSSGMTFISKACGSFPKDQVSYFEKNGIKRVATVNVAEINQEISEATRGKIKDFMPPGSYQSLCYNVLYFKRSWLPEVFIELNRHEDTSFTSLSGTTRNVKKIQTYKVQEMYCAEAHLEDNLKLTFVAIPCASVDARSGTPEMLAILAIPNVRMTLETLPKYRKGLFSSYPKLSWKRRNVSII